MGLSYTAAFVLLHKLREAMDEELRGPVVGGEGKTVEIDGGHFAGYVKPANMRENRRDRRLHSNQNGKRKAVVIVRERNGTLSPPCSALKAKPSISSARALRPVRSFRLTTPRHGMRCTRASR